MDSPTLVRPAAIASFLLRCTRSADYQRFFYPCNAKAREPVTCRYELADARPESNSHVVVEVHECEYVEGGTGWRVWPCALLLSSWLATHHNDISLRGVTVVELGCGLGLPGLVAAALGAHRTILTDCLPRLLDT